MTGWTLEPCYPRSTPPMFQCLLLEDGREPEWCEGERLTSHGGSWMPNIGQAPDWHDGSVSSSWRILEADVPTKYYLSPAQCAHFLKLAEIAGCPPPKEIEALFLKQGGGGNVKKCAVGKYPKSEKHGNTAQFSEVERSGTQENCGGIGSGCRLRLRPLPVLHRRQSQWVARIDPNAVVVDKNIAENDRFDLFSR